MRRIVLSIVELELAMGTSVVFETLDLKEVIV